MLLERGIKNGVEGLRIIERDELVKMEPNISDEAVAALYAPTGGIVCPFNLNIAMAENACTNGVEFKFNTQVEGIEKKEDGFLIHTNKGDFEARCVVNAAGVYADQIDVYKRQQCALVADMEKKWDEMKRIVEEASK